MARGEVNANICEIDGAYYQAQLQWIPRVGELIDLYSFADAAASHAPNHRYEVVQVVHKVHDVSEKAPADARGGSHFVTIHVKRSADQFFDS